MGFAAAYVLPHIPEPLSRAICADLIGRAG
jgi:hypothetical protein